MRELVPNRKKVAVLRVEDCSKGPSYHRVETLLGDRGHLVKIIGWDMSGRLSASVATAAYTVVRLRHRVPNHFGAVPLHLPAYWRFARKQLEQFAPDVIVACNLDALVVALRYGHRHKRPVIFYCLDSYPAVFPAFVPTSLRNMVARYEQKLARRASFIIIVDEERFAQLGFTAPPENSVVVYNAPVERGEPRVWPFANEARLRIFYGGRLDPDRGVATLAEAVALTPDVQLLVAGFGPDEGRIQQLAKQSEQIRYVGPVTHDAVLGFTEATNVVACFYDPSIPNNLLASPNKLFEAMAASRPCLTNAETLAGRRVEQLGMGITVPFGDRSALQTAISRLRDDPHLRAKLGGNAQEAFNHRFSWKASVARLQPMLARFGL